MIIENEQLADTQNLPAPTTLCEAFQRTASTFADRIAIRTAGGQEEYTWREYGDRVRAVAAGLSALGIGRDDTVAMVLDNRPEAFFVDAGALHAGATPFSLYTTASVAQLEYFLGHAGARVAVVQAKYADRVLEARKSLPALAHVFVLDGEVPGTEPLSALEQAGRPDFDFEASWRSVTADDVAVLIYTSGTTGAPKAVEITHGNVIGARRSWTAAIPDLARPGRYMSYLPMAHMADRQVAYYPAILTGSTVTTFTDPKVAMTSLREVRPTFSATVPRMWEKLKHALDAQFAQNPGVRAAVDAAMTKVRLEMAGEPVPAELAESCRQADAAIFAKVREQLGYDDVDALMSGAAPIGEDVMVFFAALGLPILEVYGMSESSTAGAANRKDGIRIGTVGPALPGMELRLADDGEVLLRGAAVMRGYRNDPAKTAEAIDADGWLHTGDVGELDADGYLRIVDRKKELIINSYGKNMSPAHIENTLKSASGLIGYAIAIGDGKPYNTALLVLDPEGAASYAQARGLADASPAVLADDEGLIAMLTAAIDDANRHLSRVEQIKKFTIIRENWIPDSDVLTPTMKLKRKPIHARYAADIEAMYRI